MEPFVFLRSTDRSVSSVIFKGERVYKHVVQCVIMHQSHSSQSFLTWCIQYFHSPPPPSWCAVWSGRRAAIFWFSSPSTAVVKFTSKFKWRLTLPALSLFPFQTSTLKIYSVGDKQDAAALGPWRSWKLTSVFTDVLWDGAKSLVFNSLNSSL